MRLRNLESRIILLYLALPLAVQLAGFGAIKSELAINECVSHRLLDQYAHNLMQGARLLARHITGPLCQLDETAKRLVAGDYEGPIEIERLAV